MYEKKSLIVNLASFQMKAEGFKPEEKPEQAGENPGGGNEQSETGGSGGGGEPGISTPTLSVPSPPHMGTKTEGDPGKDEEKEEMEFREKGKTDLEVIKELRAQLK